MPLGASVRQQRGRGARKLRGCQQHWTDVTQQAAVPAEAFTPGTAAWPPRTRANLRRPGGSQIDARSSNSIDLMIQLSDLFRTRVVVNKIRCRQASFSSQGVDLPFNQLKNFTFVSGGGIRHHRNSLGKLKSPDCKLHSLQADQLARNL